MSIKKNKNQLIISIIVGVAIAVISYQVIVKLKIENDNLKKLTQTSQSAPIKKIMYVVAKTDIKKGDKIQADNLTTKQFPIEIEGAVENASKISGLTAIKDIKADSPIVEDYFKVSDMDIAQGEPRSGYRALGVGLETLPPFAREGANVDIYFAKNAIQAQDVKILSIIDAPNEGKKYVMLEIRDCDVPAFITAASSDKAVLIQRNRHEKTGYKFSANGSVMLSQISDGAPPELVEVSDISYDEPSVRGTSHPAYKKQADDVPIVKSKSKASEEIEFISGDKRVIIGAPQ